MTLLKLIRAGILLFILPLFAQNDIIKNHIVDQYRLDVYLPPNYTESESYPVIYFNDGQMLFGHSNSLQLHQQLDLLINNKTIKPLIVVGIYAPLDRTSFYVPFSDAFISQGDYNFEPKANLYAKTLINQIIPLIDKTYSTKDTKDHRAIFGLSHGGLNATWMQLNYPNVFGMAAAFSPSYWVDDYEIFKLAESFSPNNKLWFDIGTSEWNYYVPMIDPLLKSGAQYGKHIFYYEVLNGTHQTNSWKHRVTYPIIVFAANNELTIKSMKTHIEVIPSQSQHGVYYQRLNPVVTLNNGVMYSLANQAKYNIIAGDGEITADGRFTFNSSKNLQVEVSYQDFQNIITIDYNKIALQKH